VFYRVLASVLPTKACVESDFSCLKGAKEDYSGNLSDITLEVVMQASDLLPDLVDVPFTPPISRGHH
jgi:hypothetical protein